MKVWVVLTDLGLRLWRDPGEKSKPPTAHMQGKLPVRYKVAVLGGDFTFAQSSRHHNHAANCSFD